MYADALTLENAKSLLGLTGPVGAEGLTAAFRAAVKAARPDAPGGDAETFRRVIAAYRLLQAQTLALPAPAGHARPKPFTPPPPPAPLLVLTPMQAISGGCVRMVVGARTLLVHAPPGVRTGDKIRLKGGGPNGADALLPVLIRPADGLSVLGGDLFMTWAVPQRMMDDGGRIEIMTHAGLRSSWLVPDMVEPVRLRLKGLGLPARGNRPAGDLFVKLEASADLPSAAEDLLLRFTRVWTPQRIAA
ncbi:DnaJ C-terminal domain-containing protein [Brevundimonas bullata]|uniref:DnaJ C-terminal domain-containing protein n=1 Tax=Brevundimonas bullata TaxID=13160 RepID=UPI000E0ABAAC|nr:DnaJ C-terminal domain-containing protein [Brevundimonas bullata]WQE35618.1 DnaJ C-terminal domain-containing protein [Brevundimonas bullata]